MTCLHMEDLDTGIAASGDGCVECLATGGRWVHLRRCLACGYIGCCDNSPGRHATGHFNTEAHPLIQSFEPGEDWVYCYIDDSAVMIDGAPPSPSHS